MMKVEREKNPRRPFWMGLFIGGGTGALFYCHLPTDSHPMTRPDTLLLILLSNGGICRTTVMFHFIKQDKKAKIKN